MGGSLRILFVVPYLPSLIRVRPFNLIRALAQRRHRITLLALQPPRDDTGGLSALKDWCQSVQVILLPRWRTIWNGLGALTSRVPLQAAYSRSPQMTQLISSTLQANRYDVVHLEHLRGAELNRAIRASAGPPVVFDAVDSISLLFEHAAQHAPRWQHRLLAWLDLARTRRYESQFTQRFSRVLVTSPVDCDKLATLATRYTNQPVNNRLEILPNGVDLSYFRPLKLPQKPDTVIFSGKMSYHANIAAAIDLVRSVMPIVWAERPQVEVFLVGKDPAPVVQDLADDPRVHVTGTVPDIRPHLCRSAVAISALRYSVGIQNKVLEAMAVTTPVVTTSDACRALMAEPGTHLLVGDSAPALAQAVLTLLSDDDQRRRIGKAGRRYVETHHDWDSIAARLECVYREVIDETLAR